MKIGNKVSVIDEDIVGVVVSIDKYIVIEDDYGFQYSIAKEKVVTRDERLYEKNIPISIKEESKSGKISKKHNHDAPVLDLHFDKIVQNPHEFSSWERLMIQRETLVARLDHCRENNIKMLEVVYGIGDGVLQKMVFDVLSGYVDLEFENHDFFYHQTGSVSVFLIKKC